MRALVVEDEAALREGLRAQLVEQGFTVDVAADGNEGLFAGTEYPLDIAVIDLGLPKLSGLDLIRALRKGGKFRLHLTPGVSRKDLGATTVKRITIRR